MFYAPDAAHVRHESPFMDKLRIMSDGLAARKGEEM
jgi:hypothetical protein